MARRRKTPETSKLTRGTTVAYARKQKSGSDGDDAGDDKPDAIETGPVEAGKRSEAKTEPGGMPAVRPPAVPAAEPPRGINRDDIKTEPVGVPALRPTAAPPSEPAKPAEAAKPDAEPKASAPATDSPKASADAAPPEPAPPAWPEATPRPTRIRQETMAMPTTMPVGQPPPVPIERVIAAAPATGQAVEDPTRMPNPKDIPPGSPDDPAPAPGRVPPGDSRSLRRGDEFALIYRIQTFVITRFGVVGRRGQWRVVEYPTSASASHSYAKECSRFVSEGFSDYRE